jgi:hypothetical protein
MEMKYRRSTATLCLRRRSIDEVTYVCRALSTLGGSTRLVTSQHSWYERGYGKRIIDIEK